jgi:hypothetical protein
MKKSTIVKITASLAIIFLGYANSWGQDNEDPTIPAGYVQHPNPYGTPAYNANIAHIDSITHGALNVGYFVLPDPAIASASNTYTWGSTGTAISSITKDVTNGNKAVAVFNSGTLTGTGTITVTETSSAGCPGSTTTIDYAVIAAPTTEFTAASAAGVCLGVADGSAAQTLSNIPIAFTCGIAGPNKNLVVTYNVSCTSGSFTAVNGATANVTVTGPGAGTFNIPTVLNYYGTYTVTVTAINDRISTKSAVNGTTADINGGGIQSTYTFAVTRTPVTGPIYHLSN